MKERTINSTPSPRRILSSGSHRVTCWVMVWSETGSGGTTMDSVAFDAWLAAIKVMSAEQRRKGAERLALAGTDDDLNTADVPASSGDGANLAVDTIFPGDDIADDSIKGVIPEETAKVTPPTPPALALVV